jgi:hypothetical protein
METPAMKTPFFRWIAFIGLFLISLPLTGGAAVDNAPARSSAHPLSGEYEFSSLATCVQGEKGFGPDLELLGPAREETFVTRGAITFKENGEGHIESNWIARRAGPHDPGDRPVRGGYAICDFTTEGFPDSSLALQVTCESETLYGPGKGNAWLIEGIELEGQSLLGGRAFLMSDTDVNIETLTRVWPLPVPPNKAEILRRICQRTGFAVKPGSKSTIGVN